jgi:hypothetical protein
MSTSRPPRFARLRCLSALLTLFTLAACESGRPGRPNPAADNGAPEPDRPVPEMEAHGTFFAGQIEVETLLNRAGFTRQSGGGGADNGAAATDSGNGGSRGGRARGSRAGSGPSSSSAASDEGEPVPHIHPSNLPALRLHLRLTNHGSAPVEVEVLDFDSDLGNFVVEPPKILLPPDQPTETDPMTSRLGVSSDSIPLTVTLRVNGQTEKQVLVLQTVKPAAPPGPPASPAPAPPP